MSTTQNKRLMEHIYAQIEQGNSRPFVDAMADDFRWVITGDSCWSRTYEGKQAVLNELFPKLRASLANRIRTRATRFIAEDDLVVVEARGDNVTRNGMPYNNSYCMIFTVLDGRIHQMVEYMDTDLAIRALGDPAAIAA